MERTAEQPPMAPNAASSWTWRAPQPTEDWNWSGADARTPHRSPARTRFVRPLAALVGLLTVFAGAALANEGQAEAHAPTTAAVSTSASQTEAPAPMPVAVPDVAARTPKSTASIDPGDVPETVTWETKSSYTLRELSRAWGISESSLSALNPSLGTGRIPAGTRVSVYSLDHGADVSVGAPNKGRLVRGVAMPEDPAWKLVRGRDRAYGTAKTIGNLTATLAAYTRRFPDAPPVELGDISARRGGKISDHSSHQSGRDADVMLVRSTSSSRSYDPQRNWFLVKTLIDLGSVQAIYLNASEQGWLKETAIADVGDAAAAEYFKSIRHERGHDFHMHVRFLCPKGQSRCVNYTR